MRLARDKPRFGYRRLQVLLQREGASVNHKRVQRVYRKLGLSVKRTRRKKLMRMLRPQPVPDDGSRNGVGGDEVANGGSDQGVVGGISRCGLRTHTSNVRAQEWHGWLHECLRQCVSTQQSVAPRIRTVIANTHAKPRTVLGDNPREPGRACPTPLVSSCRTKDAASRHRQFSRSSQPLRFSAVVPFRTRTQISANAGF